MPAATAVAHALAYSVALAPNGKIVVAGRRVTGTDDLAFARSLAA